MAIQEIANRYLSYFELGKREDGSVYYYIKDGAPETVYDMVIRAHDGMLPDDYKHKFIVQALEMIADYNGEYENIEDLAYDIEADYYYGDLLDWLQSNTTRIYYVDEAVSEYGHGESVMDDIANGQIYEKQEIFNIILKFIQDDLEGEDVEEEEYEEEE